MKTQNSIIRTLGLLALVLLSVSAKAQSVGVVLSGGGATALTHVGFLRALEEQNIPIDFIGGTSMGASIAAMYAAGFSVHEIDSMCRSREFLDMVQGTFDDQLRFYFKAEDADAGMARIRYSEGKLINNALPTNLIDPALLDWNLMAMYAGADMASAGNFDSLFVPYRCVAADVQNKREIIFRQGPINVAVRASSTYPFYLPPLRLNGVLVYDGGIFNNFPIDVVYREFMPDVILGCNVSGEPGAPTEDDIFSQLQTMILYRGTFREPCEQLFVVQPSLPDVGTFDWHRMSEAIDEGYKATMDSIARIKELVTRRADPLVLQARRKAFRNKQQKLSIEQVNVDGLNRAQSVYARKVFGKRVEPSDIEALKRAYFRLYEDDKIKSVFPTTTYLPVSGKYALHLDVRREKNLTISVGGNFSSRSINTGFVGLRYNLFGASAALLEGNSYFGRFYGSVHAGLRWDFSGRRPWAFTGYFTQNRWDYYRSLSTFFEDVKPSFVLLNERFGGVSFIAPAGNKGMLKFDALYTYQFDQYYQTQNFLSKDTADRTDFSAIMGRFTWERNTLNRKQWANAGTLLRITAKYMNGLETSIPGSTSALRERSRKWHDWVVVKLTYQNYFFRRRAFHLGILLEGVASNQNFFNNYLASSIAASAFQPIPESRTFFIPQFRAHNYAAGGMQAVWSISKNIDFRAEAYMFNAFGRILSKADGTAHYNYAFVPLYMAQTSLVLQTPFGPLSFSGGYYDLKDKPWSVLFNFGYILFNRSPRD